MKWIALPGFGPTLNRVDNFNPIPPISMMAKLNGRSHKR